VTGSVGASGIDIVNPSEVSESCGAGTRLKRIAPSALAADLPRSAPLTVALMQGWRRAENTVLDNCRRYSHTQSVDVDDYVSSWSTNLAGWRTSVFSFCCKEQARPADPWRALAGV
jgi:hypothetical protein